MEDNNDELLDEQNEAVEAQVSLPQDIQQTALAFLPGRVVFKLRAVCRFWRDCIQVPSFVDRHLNNALCFHQSIAFFTSVDDGLFCMYTFDPTTLNRKSLDFVLSFRFQMSDPCNGLVCAYDSRGAVEVLNPLTMKHVILPVSEHQSRALSSEYFLGSVQSKNEYKVVCIRHRVRFLTFEVCTVGTQLWRAVRESANLLKTTKAVIVNDVMHWLLLDAASDFTRRILLFNLTDEIFSETAVPDTIKDHNLELFEGEGKLHLLAMPSKGSASEVSEIWVSNSACTVWDHMCNITFLLPPGMRPHFLHKKKLFYGNQKRFYYIDLEGGGGSYINVPSDETIVSSGIFVDSLLLHSVTGLVDSRTLLMGSDNAGSSSHAAGSSSSGAGQSFKEAKSNRKMKWRLTRISAKKT
ncbi:putative F-box protein At2g02030 [Lolium rigidum]|uniref:putative F-box protein At2g02030 n=1 Tax=Lolium rigidum TaxID=89674 RepID=UPI001F5E1106|nr:putative F-box protein At2g02030 [Lolium rigidum]